MTDAAIGQRLTFEDYLNDDDGADTHYELVAGELIAMPPESRWHSQISLFLVTVALLSGTAARKLFRSSC